jgi:hypothetical protein
LVLVLGRIEPRMRQRAGAAAPAPGSPGPTADHGALGARLQLQWQCGSGSVVVKV